jgi:hypothetical protein
MQMAFGKAITQAVSVVARFRLADQMASGPKTAAELAAGAGLSAGHLYRVLRALAGLGVLKGDGDGRFALTPVGELLRSDVPGSLRAVATYVCDPWSWKPWGELAGCVRSGAPAFDRAFGEGVFDYFAEHPDEAATFNEGMTGFSQQASAAVLAAYDFAPFNTAVDVGGDLYVLKHIIHDWNDAKATQILKCVRAAIPATGKLLLVELVVPPGFPPHFAHVLDLEMMVICDGKERTEAEYRDLLAGAGFRLTRVVPTEGPHSLVEAVPV